QRRPTPSFLVALRIEAPVGCPQPEGLFDDDFRKLQQWLRFERAEIFRAVLAHVIKLLHFKPSATKRSRSSAWCASLSHSIRICSDGSQRGTSSGSAISPRRSASIF